MRIDGATRRQLLGTGSLGYIVAVTAVVFSPSTILDWFLSLGDEPVLFLGTLFVLYLLRPFLAWPLSVLSITTGFVLGTELGIPVALAGMCLSNSVVFSVARYFQEDSGLFGVVSRSSDSLVKSIGGFRSIVAARLSPLPADIVSSAAGLSSVSWRTYLLGTLVGEWPWIVAEVIAGGSMRTLSIHGLSYSLSLFFGASILAVLLLLRPVYRHISGTDSMLA